MTPATLIASHPSGLAPCHLDSAAGRSRSQMVATNWCCFLSVVRLNRKRISQNRSKKANPCWIKHFNCFIYTIPRLSWERNTMMYRIMRGNCGVLCLNLFGKRLLCCPKFRDHGCGFSFPLSIRSPPFMYCIPVSVGHAFSATIMREAHQKNCYVRMRSLWLSNKNSRKIADSVPLSIECIQSETDYPKSKFHTLRSSPVWN